LILLDLTKAFDTVCRSNLLLKLEHNGTRGNALNLITTYLLNRKQYVSINNISSSLQNISIGVPQGSILGPFYF